MGACCVLCCFGGQSGSACTGFVLVKLTTDLEMDSMGRAAAVFGKLLAGRDCDLHLLVVWQNSVPGKFFLQLRGLSVVTLQFLSATRACSCMHLHRGTCKWWQSSEPTRFWSFIFWGCAGIRSSVLGVLGVSRALCASVANRFGKAPPRSWANALGRSASFDAARFDGRCHVRLQGR